jgi:hypothetical protein
MRIQVLFVASVLLGCGPDPKPHQCGGVADFSVTISAKTGPLPSDTVIKLYYGGRSPANPEVLMLSEPQTPQALFCYPVDSSGDYDNAGPAIGVKNTSSFAEVAGAGGEGGAPGSEYEAVGCDLYTDGSARLEVVTQMYGTNSLELTPNKEHCTVATELVLEPMDGGT